MKNYYNNNVMMFFTDALEQLRIVEQEDCWDVYYDSEDRLSEYLS